MKIVDLPGTYSLQAGSVDEEVARDFILFGRPDVTVAVVDATRLERNLNLVLQILDITDRVVVYLNLIDEARRRGIAVDAKRLEQELGVPVVNGIARESVGIDDLLNAAHSVARGERSTRPYRLERHSEDVEGTVASLAQVVDAAFPYVPNARWVALRLLNADEAVIEAVRSGELGQLGEESEGEERSLAPEDVRTQVVDTARRLRWELPTDFHDRISERALRRRGADRRQGADAWAEEGRFRCRQTPRCAPDKPLVGFSADARDTRCRLLDHDRGC